MHVLAVLLQSFLSTQEDFIQSKKQAALVWGCSHKEGIEENKTCLIFFIMKNTFGLTPKCRMRHCVFLCARPPLGPASFVTFLSGKEKYKEKE